MKLKKTIINLIVLTMLFIPSFVLATQLKVGDATSQLNEAVTRTGVAKTSVEEVSGNILKAVFAMVGLLFFILIFYAGFSWLIAQGKEEQIKKAQSTLIGSVIGLLIVLGSYAVTNFVTTRIITGATEGASGSSRSDSISEEVEGEKVGCCLDRWETEGGYFGVGQSGWTGQLLTEKQCTELINIKDYPTQNIEDYKDGYWDDELKDINNCLRIASTLNEDREWEQSDKWDNVFTASGEEKPDDFAELNL